MAFAVKRRTPPLDRNEFHPFLPLCFAIESYLYETDFSKTSLNRLSYYLD